MWFELDIQPIPGMACPPKDFETAQKTNKGPGRLDTRTLAVYCQLQDFLDEPYLEQVFQLKRRCVFIKMGEIQKQLVYSFTSLLRDEIAPDRLFVKIRSYWGIENGLHERRDITLREDNTLITKANAGHVKTSPVSLGMAYLNNLLLGFLLPKRVFFPFPLPETISTPTPLIRCT